MAYTKPEVDAALVASTRRWTFKHEIIDEDGESKGFVDVVDCKIHHNSLAQTVKRTAKYKMTPESLSKIDLNKDRLRSFASLQMPDGGWYDWPVGTFLLTTATNKWVGRSTSREAKASTKRMHRPVKRAYVYNPTGTGVLADALEALGWLVTENTALTSYDAAAQYDLWVCDSMTNGVLFTQREYAVEMMKRGVSVLSSGTPSADWSDWATGLTTTTAGNLRAVRPVLTGDKFMSYGWHAYTDDVNTKYYTGFTNGAYGFAVAPLAGVAADPKFVGFAVEHVSGNMARMVHVNSKSDLWSASEFGGLITKAAEWLGEERGEFAEYEAKRESVKGLVDVDGWDNLLMLEEDCVTDRYVVDSGVNYRSAVASLFTTYFPIKSVGPNIVSNPGTETDTTSWESNGGFGAYQSATALTRVTTHYATGSASLRVTIPTISGTQKTWANQYVGSMIKGQRYRLSADVFIPTGNITNVGLDVIFKYNYEYQGTIPRDQWFHITTDWTSDDTGVFFGVWIQGDTADGTYYYIDNLSIQAIETEHMLENSGLTLPAQLEWPPGTPKLTIANDLLQAINFETLSMTSMGIPIANSYRSPDQVAPIWSYKVDRDSVIVPGIDVELDLFKIPNVFVCIVSEPDRATLRSVYVNDDPNSLTSTVTRGRSIVMMVEPPQTTPGMDTEQAPDQATLDAKVLRAAQEASQQFEVATFSTGLMPFHEDSDVCWIDYGEGPLLFREHEWSMDLKAGGLMTHRFRRVVQV